MASQLDASPVHPHRDLLRGHPLLSGLTEPDLEVLAGRGQLRSARARHIVYLPGDLADHVFLLHEGRVNDLHVATCGRAIALAHHHPGGLFGEKCAWTSRPRDTMAVTATRVVYSAVPRSVLRSVLDARPALERALYERVLDRHAHTEERLCTAVTKNVTAKIAAVLLEFAAYGVDTPDGCQLPSPLPQRELAAFAATTRETVTLELGRLESMRILQRIGRLIVLLDRERLAALAVVAHPSPKPLDTSRRGARVGGSSLVRGERISLL